MRAALSLRGRQLIAYRVECATQRVRCGFDAGPSAIGIAVFVIVLAGLWLTIGLSRYAAIKKAHDRHQNDAESPEPAEQ